MRASTNNNAPAESGTGITIESFLLMLDKVSKRGKAWIARCPAHEDGRPSLRVKAGDKGILVTCFAGCSYHEITASLGLRAQDLFFDSLDSRTKSLYKFRALSKQLSTTELYLEVYLSNFDTSTSEEKKRLRELISEKANIESELRQLRSDHGFKDTDL